MNRAYWAVRDAYVHSVIDHTKMYLALVPVGAIKIILGAALIASALRVFNVGKAERP